jgi:peptidyl carrier protein
MEQTCDLVVSWLAALPTRRGDARITPETELIEDGILDSIAILDLVGFLEERFRITMPVEEFIPENFRTAAAIAALAARLGGKAG